MQYELEEIEPWKGIRRGGCVRGGREERLAKEKDVGGASRAEYETKPLA
jgi:hypothetical protein